MGDIGDDEGRQHTEYCCAQTIEELGSDCLIDIAGHRTWRAIGTTISIPSGGCLGVRSRLSSNSFNSEGVRW